MEYVSSRWPAMIVLFAAVAFTMQANAGCVDRPPSDHVHTPGDPAWIGHTEQDASMPTNTIHAELSRPTSVADPRF